MYLSNILAHIISWDEQVRHLKLVSERLRKHKMYAKISKRTFGVQEIDYLIFVLRAGKLSMNPNKTKAIKVWKAPHKKKELQYSLDLLNYYRRFICSCSKISKSLTELTKNVPLNWSNTANSVFQELEKSIIRAPVLKQFDPKENIFVTMAACKYAIGAVMEQDHDDGRQPVAYISRTLNQLEENCAAHDLELLGIVDTLLTWRCYQIGQKFVLHTDHQPVKHLETQELLTPPQFRWL